MTENIENIEAARRTLVNFERHRDMLTDGEWADALADALRGLTDLAPTPTDPATLKPGDRVRLTGRDWFNLKRRIVVIAGVAESGPNLDPTPYFYEEGLEWLIWSDDSADYSATKVKGAGS